MICPYCKEQIQDGAIKCKHCGSMLHNSATVTVDNISAEDFKTFVGQNSYYYNQAFSKFLITGREQFVGTWNWSCFGFTFLWMLYRKMYMMSLITFFIFLLPGVNLILHVVAGIVGNYLYYRHARQKILEIRSTTAPDNYQSALTIVGGTNNWVITLGIILAILMAIGFAVFFSTILAAFTHFSGVTI